MTVRSDTFKPDIWRFSHFTKAVMPVRFATHSWLADNVLFCLCATLHTLPTLPVRFAAHLWLVQNGHRKEKWKNNFQQFKASPLVHK